MKVLLLMAAAASLQRDAPVVSVCDIISRPDQFAGQTVNLRGRLTKLNRGEFGILGDCWPPILLAFPAEVKPDPPFALERTGDMDQLMFVRERFALFEATFSGRLDWSGDNPQGAPSASSFGRAKSALRLVLRRVSESTTRFPSRK